MITAGDADISVQGAISANATSSEATGVDVTASGYASIYVKHSVSAYSKGSDANGVYTYGNKGTYLHVGGDVVATAVSPQSPLYGEATGVRSAANAGYTNTVEVDGNVTVNAVHAATGINVEGGYGLAHVGGNVTVPSSAANAIGVEMNGIGSGSGTQYVTDQFGANVSGAVTVTALAGNATGVSVNGNTVPLGDRDYNTINAYTGAVTVHAGDTALGVQVGGYGDISARVAGNLKVTSDTGKATGMTLSSAGAPGGYSDYYGNYITSVGDGVITANVTGNVVVFGVKGAYGIVASGGYTTVNVGGVRAWTRSRPATPARRSASTRPAAIPAAPKHHGRGRPSMQGGSANAYGVKAGAAYDSTIAIGGGVAAYAGFTVGNMGNAVGISSHSGYDTNISVGRYVVAYGGLTATGIDAIAGAGNLAH